MLQKIKTLILSLSLVFAFAMPALVTSTAQAAPHLKLAADITGNLCSGADQLSISTNEGNGTCTLSNSTCDANCVIRKVVNVLSVVVGIIAVIMIIIGGLRYVTSGGKDESVKGAKNTILYALIGLVIVALAQTIVRFVLSKSTTG